MAAAGTIESITLALGKALKPLSGLLTPDLFAKLGVPLPQSIENNAGIISKLAEVKTLVNELPGLITNLETSITSQNVQNILIDGAELIKKITGILVKIKELGVALNTAILGLPANIQADLKNLADNLPIRILEYCLIGYLGEYLPLLTRSLNLIGAIDKETILPPGMVLNTPLPGIIPRRIYLNRLLQILSNPQAYLQETYKLGLASFTGKEILERTRALLISLGIPAEIAQVGAGPLVLKSDYFEAELDASINPPGIKFEAKVSGNNTFDKSYPISNLWKARIQNTRSFNAGLKGKLQYPLQLTLQPVSGSATMDTALSLIAKKSNNEAFMLLGLTKGTRLEAKSINASVALNTALENGTTKINPFVQVAIEGGKLIIDFSDSDGFIKTLLSNVKTEANFDLKANWDAANGLRLEGSGGLDILIPLHIDLALFLIEGLYFKLGFKNTELNVGLGVIIKTNLGPLVAVVDGIGTDFPISFPDNLDGNISFANLGTRFVPPTRVGLSIDTGVIKGGGFLGVNVEKGEYIGALELSFQGFIDLKAIAIISTKMPDGSEGFALLILITAEFVPIQLGFGFTLVGVGGLLAVNRRTEVEALKEGIRTGAVSSILFPQDIVNNITRIISDLQQVFPISKGTFIIAPMAKIGWGTPTLISLEMGIIIDIPATKLIILGVLRCILPTEEAPLLKLQVNFLGVIDFSQGISFNAVLYDSRLLAFTLTGEMALRIGWGNQPIFVLSVGGFHPSFNEVPTDLRNMKRITISLLSGKNPRISVATYFAVTSNTVQSGARVELYAEACGFNVFGYLGYDLLVQFNPFYFIAQIEAGIALRRGSSEIAGIHLAGQLSGPTPWRALGKASLKILFVKVSVKFDVTWGDQAPPQLEESIDVKGLIIEAMKDDSNWKADLPANTNTNVTLRKLELLDGKIIIHPFTILSLSQKVTPLDMEINKFGNNKPSDDTRFTLSVTDNSATQPMQEEFAIGNFIKLKDSEKLSRKSFERMKSGIKFQTTNEVLHGTELQKEVVYELSYVHRKKGIAFIIKVAGFKLFDKVFNIFSKGNAISKNAYSVSNKVAAIKPAKVELNTGLYSVVNTKDLTAFNGTNSVNSEAEAYALHDELLRKNPSLKNHLQVVSQFELN
ncbi:DUF6603 domain-containing protein [Pedobacter sp.]|uniref:DUF6603 domain-containing protein n=1 Tax=Pedobacter sp. TaxID=1411316 RepID=UPI003BAB939B